MNNIINGLIIDASSKKGAVNLTIEAWEQDVKYPDLVGKETTDAFGRFQMRFDETHWKDNPKDKNPRIFFKVYDASGNLLRDTRNQVYWTAEQKENDIVVVIGAGIGGSDYRLIGRILLASGKPAVNVRVQAFLNTLKSDKKAGAAVQTDAFGSYAVTYKPELKGNHLSVKVYDSRGELLLSESETVYKAGPQETIDLSLPESGYGGIAEFERILQTVTAETGTGDITKLSAKKLAVLAADTSIDSSLLKGFHGAQMIAKSYNGLLASIAYALILSKSGNTNASNLFDLSTADFSHVIAEAVRTWVIAPLNLKLLKLQQDLYQSIRIRMFMNTPAFESKTSLSGLWTAASFTEAQQQKISEKYLAAKSDQKLFWSTIEKDTLLKPIAPKLKLANGIHNLSLGNTAVIKLLVANNSITVLENLALWTFEKWMNVVNDKAVSASIPKEIPGKTLAEKKANYARSMKRMVDYLFPTKAMQGYIMSAGSYSATFKTDLNIFLKNNPAFLIENTNVSAYVRKNKAALNGLKDKDAFARELEILSLRFAMTPGMDKAEHVEKLSTLQISSSLEVMNMGNAQFIRRYSALGATLQEAEELFSNARQIASAAQMALVQRTDFSHMPSVLSDLKQDATWQNLFGPQDYCQCKECRSVYSPAAYLTDLLHFLQQRQVKGGTNAYNILMKRRPDIKNILLNCDNAHTPLPYIDLVNEVLENAVDGGATFEHNTTGIAAELKSMPEYFNKAAYDKLLNADYPWNMPFDFYTETRNAFMEHLGASNYKLISLFDKSTEQDFNRSLSYNGFSVAEWGKLSGNYYSLNEKRLWGYAGSVNLDEVLKPVETFLQRTQCSYSELESLLKTKYINASRALRIEFIKTCDLTTASFNRMEKGDRKKIYHFTKLYLKLKLSIDELDKVLTALNISEPGTQDIINLAEFIEVYRSCKLPVSEVVSWFGTMPTKLTGAKEQERELYDEVFLNKTIIFESEDDSDSMRAKFHLNDAFNQLLTPIGIDDIRAIDYMAASLQITKEEIEALTVFFAFTGYSLQALSRLYAVSSYTKFLGISISDYIALNHYLGFAAYSGTYRRNFANAVSTLKHSSLSFSDISFLLSPQMDKETAEKIGSVYDELEAVIGKFNTQGNNAPEAPLTLNSILITSICALLDIKKETLEAYPSLKERLTILSESTQKDSALAFLQELNKAAFIFNKLSFKGTIEKRLIYHSGINFASLSFESLLLLTDLKAVEQLIERSGNGLIGLIGQPINNTLLLKINGYLSKGLDLPESFLIKFIEIIGKPGTLFQTEQLRHALEFKRVISLFGINKVSDLVILRSLTDPTQEGKHLDFISTMAKSKYGTAAWLDISKKLRDPIREKQRDGLTAYLVAHNNSPDFSNAEDLYSYYLIDTQMSACMQSSRILLAISTTQLFIQRCLMNLEPEVDQSNITDATELKEWGEWVWRKNYRVWEANRKIFLYPENWLEPEWRDDKTPFFMELEEELMQSELTRDLAEKAYLNYLNKLETISGIEVMALYEDQANSIYYIFGRIKSSASEWYLRKYYFKTEHFSPWEKIELNIQSDHLCPVILNGALHLFWPAFSNQNKPAETQETEEYPNTVKYVRIHLEWSKFHNHKWSTVKKSDAYFNDDSPISQLSYAGLYDDTIQSNCLFYKKEEDRHLFYILRGTYYAYAVCCFGYEPADNSIQVMEPETFTPYNLPEVSADYNHPSPLKFDISNQKLVKKVKSNGVIAIDNILLKSQRNQLIQVTPIFETIISYNDKPLFYPQMAYAYKLFIYSDLSGNYLVKPGDLNGNLISRFVPISFPGLQEMFARLSEIGFDFIKDKRLESSIYSQGGDPFSKSYDVAASSNIVYPEFKTGYDITDANCQYNWELFFHIPMMIANRLSVEQKFDEARNWYHYIFDPTSRNEEDSVKRFWRFKPFYDFAGVTSISELMYILNEESEQAGNNNYETVVALWEQDVFNPHLTARHRIIAYMKNVVMKYIDNLVSWADHLFRQDTMESLNEATQLYMLAWNILGREPVILSSTETSDRTFNALSENGLDAFSNSMFRHVETRLYHGMQNRSRQERENARWSYLGVSKPAAHKEPESKATTPEKSPVVLGYIRELLYFCLPPNRKLLDYWGLLQDRFYKLRHCRNIEGTARQLPLYEPPIDPALLIKARLAGINTTDVIEGGLNDNPSHYRFSFVVGKAADYANDVRNLGSMLLSALEKRDAESFAMLRSEHELKLLNAVTVIRKNQVRELQESLRSLEYTLSMANKKYRYYSSKKLTNSKENRQMKLIEMVNTYQVVSQSTMLAASVARKIPEFSIGYSGIGPHSTVSIGGQVFSDVLQTVSDSFSLAASLRNMEASAIGQMASYERRYEDWQHQADLSAEETEQINKQILSAQIRIAIAEKELENHELQIEQSSEQQDVLQSKFTNKELYNWMIGQLKTLYFQSYQMAFDMAKKAEKALNYELRGESETFIKYGYWDNLKQGLLSGDKLFHDLKRMEMAYLERNKRLHEISKTVSLAMTDAKELIRLKDTGSCHIVIPEILFKLPF